MRATVLLALLLAAVTSSSKIAQLKIAAGAAVASCLIGDSMLTAPHPAHAAGMASLADVGVKEFLVKDPREWIRLSLPTSSKIVLGEESKGDLGRQIQDSVELARLRLEQVGFSSPAIYSKATQDAAAAQAMVQKSGDALIAAAIDKAKAAALKDKLVPTLDSLVDAMKNRDIVSTLEQQEKASALLYELRATQLPANSLSYEVPEEFRSLPILKGRAVAEMVVESRKGFRVEGSSTKVPIAVFELTLDGYHSPLTAGNFVDLVSRKYYDGSPVDKAEQLIVQIGLAGRSDVPKRTIPLELFYRNDKMPVYGISADDDNRASDALALPFQATGAIGMARDNEDADSASSQLFFLKYNQALNPPGRNTIDGFYSCFGYITSPNEALLDQIQLGDKIVSIKMVSGMENFNK